jgi:hypothetical protein
LRSKPEINQSSGRTTPGKMINFNPKRSDSLFTNNHHRIEKAVNKQAEMVYGHPPVVKQYKKSNQEGITPKQNAPILEQILFEPADPNFDAVELLRQLVPSRRFDLPYLSNSLGEYFGGSKDNEIRNWQLYNDTAEWLIGVWLKTGLIVSTDPGHQPDSFDDFEVFEKR